MAKGNKFYRELPQRQAEKTEEYVREITTMGNEAIQWINQDNLTFHTDALVEKGDELSKRMVLDFPLPPTLQDKICDATFNQVSRLEEAHQTKYGEKQNE